METYGSESSPKEVQWTFRKLFWWIFGIIIFIILLVGVTKVILTPAKTVKDLVQKNLDVDNVLENYEWYKRQYHDWEAINVKIEQADQNVERFKEEAGPRSSWDYNDKEESSRLSSIADGLRYQREDIESKYNARSQMLNRKIFKSNDLPYQLKNGVEEKDE